jgi:Tol biopolymer transport system component
MGAETPLRITADPADERSPAWSPDGRSLAFIRKSKDQQQIIVVPAIGGSERVLADFGQSEVQRLIWSPDGLSMAVSAQDTAYGAYSIFLLSNETLEKRRLTFPPSYALGDQDPSFSADGKRLAFVRVLTDQVQDLYVVSTQGGEPVRQTYDYEAITGLDWSSEGEDIVFASGRGGTSNLWRLPGNGGKPQWIAAAGDAAVVHHPSVSRTNGRLTYVRYSSNTNIWKYDRTGPPRSLISSTRWDSNPSISPDGEHIAFVSRRSGNLEVWMCDQEGNFPVQLTDNRGGVASTPRWSPGGGRIAYTYWQEGNADIKVIDVAGGKPNTLIDWPSHEVGASWSRDGLWVYFASNRGGSWQIWKISSEGGQAYQVTREGGITAFDGGEGHLYYVKDRTPGIWRMPVEGGQETLVIASLHPDDAANWQVVDRGIYFIRRDATGPAIAFYSFITEKTLRTAVLDQVPHDAAFSVSADRQWFLFSKTEQPESDILLIEDIR